MPRGGKRPGAGRPRKDTAAFNVRLTPAERARARAVLRGLESLASMARHALLAEVEHRESLLRSGGLALVRRRGEAKS